MTVQGAPQTDGFGLQVLGCGEQGVGGHGGMVRPRPRGRSAGARPAGTFVPAVFICVRKKQNSTGQRQSSPSTIDRH